MKTSTSNAKPNTLLLKLFGFDTTKHKLTVEIIAGLTTFVTMAYCLALIPSTLSKTGMDAGSVFTATALGAIISTLLMGVIAKKPFALAPGVGLCAFFTYSVCLSMGYSWTTALTAVFIEGVIFVILTVTNVRGVLVDVLPANLQKAISAGIGLFIAFIGLQNAGVVIGDDATIVALAPVKGSALLCLIGVIITAVLLVKRVVGALLVGVIITTLIGIPMGITELNGIVNTPPSIAPTFMQLQWDQIFSPNMIMVLFVFLFVDIFDTIGTVVGVTEQAKELLPPGEGKNGKTFKRIFLVDSIGTIFGSLLGTNTISTYVESSSGVASGGRTGLTAVVVAVCFALGLFFAPLFLAIPAAAVSPVLVIVGAMMATSLKDIDYSDFTESIPAFICLIAMPLTYNIANGIVMGMISYVAINLLTGNHHKLNIASYIIAAILSLKFFV